MHELGEHPADRLIRELVRTGRRGTPGESDQILERMATAAFERNEVRVRMAHRGLTYLGQTLGTREDSLFYHLVKRFVVERQWSEGTTAQQYMADLRHAVLHPSAPANHEGDEGR